jgi:hypothetical protein
MTNIQKIRTLESIAVKIRDLAIAKAPKDTGNLRKQIYKANTPVKTKMIKQLKDFSIELSLDYAPIGATYGQWFNDPPEVRSKQRKKLQKTAIKRGNWNYGINAMNDDDLSKQFEDYLAEIGDYLVSEIEVELEKP